MNIINALPGIVPTARAYTMGEWPQSRLKMRNGRTVRWGLSSIPTGDKMALTWENITFAQAEQIASIWDSSYGLYGELTLPDETLAGTSEELAAFMELPFPGATWHFTGSPQISSVKAKRCTMQIPIGVRGYSSYSASLET